nr:beta-1,3-glucan-binding protein-like [Leptinotarsa decemlineata]
MIILYCFAFLSSFSINFCKGCDKSITTVSGTHAPKQLCSGDLIFEDDFEELDLRKWQHVQTLGGGGNWQFQWYTNNRSNSYVEDGILHIRPTLVAADHGKHFLHSGTIDINGGTPADQCTNPKWNGCTRTGTREIVLNPIKGAYIRTVNSFSFKYGKLEVRAKVPLGDWLWPAIWMMPRWNQYSSWPASGEIDILESRGNRHFVKFGEEIGVEQVGSTLHFGPDSKHDVYSYTKFSKNDKNGWNTKFHKFQLEWTPEKISFSIDDDLLGTVVPPDGGFWELGKFSETNFENPWRRNSKIAPFDSEFYIIINLAVGGTSFFSEYGENSPYKKPWKNSSGRKAVTDFWKAREEWLPTWNMHTDDSHFQVDYVKVWAL